MVTFETFSLCCPFSLTQLSRQTFDFSLVTHLSLKHATLRYSIAVKPGGAPVFINIQTYTARFLCSVLVELIPYSPILIRSTTFPILLHALYRPCTLSSKNRALGTITIRAAIIFYSCPFSG